jgi:hypothetical protein
VVLRDVLLQPVLLLKQPVAVRARKLFRLEIFRVHGFAHPRRAARNDTSLGLRREFLVEILSRAL